MEKHSTQQSTVSSASRANEQTPDKELHYRLQTNNSSDTTNTTMPNTSQRNHVHSTSSQNQCAHDSAGHNASTPTLEQSTGNDTITSGMDGNTPHRDRGTQMPSQEIHAITITQSTLHPKQIIQTEHEPIQIVDADTGRDNKNTHSVHKERQNTEDTIPVKVLVPEALQTHPDNQQISTGDRTREFPTENHPHIVTTVPLKILNTPRNYPKDHEAEIIIWGKQRDESSKTTIKSTPDNKPYKDHTRTDSNIGQKRVKPHTVHITIKDSNHPH